MSKGFISLSEALATPEGLIIKGERVKPVKMVKKTRAVFIEKFTLEEALEQGITKDEYFTEVNKTQAVNAPDGITFTVYRNEYEQNKKAIQLGFIEAKSKKRRR